MSEFLGKIAQFQVIDVAALIFILLLVVSVLLVVFHPNILYAAFSLLATFFSVAAFYVFIGADFLAGVQVLIYVGGILILILFLEEETKAKHDESTNHQHASTNQC